MVLSTTGGITAMKEWINGPCDHVDRLTKQQPYYQELLAQRNNLEARYNEILQSLTNEEAEVICEYFFLTTEMDYQRIQTAYEYGCRWR